MSAINELPFSLANNPSQGSVTELTLRLTPFDHRRYHKLIAARAETIRRVIGKLKPLFHLSSAVDVGCGVGFFSKTMDECGLHVCGFDGREQNIREARRRFPSLPFETADLQDGSILDLGRFDFVVCCGLLHHLENPLLAIRHLRALTEKCLFLESICTPDEKPSLLFREDAGEDERSLAEIAWYPSEGGLVKMLYRAGFATVYRVTPLPNHEDFRDTPAHARRRTVLLASCAPIDVAGFRLCPEPHEKHDPWSKKLAVRRSIPKRIGSFLASPARRQYITLALRMRQHFPEMPIPLRLPFGAWWLAEKGELDHELMYNNFEETEIRFVRKMLRPGMTFLDIGAHHGLYTLLASKMVGANGRVISFEPSPRECRRLMKHVRVNRCKNVEVETCAVADRSGEAELFLVNGFRDWGNSLRPPAVPEPTQSLRVAVCRLDDLLAERNIQSVDFMKLDAEGAELAVLEGACGILQRDRRPVVLAEVQDVRTRPWGYAAREIMQFLTKRNYRWYSIGEAGELYAESADEERYDGNYVAIPNERTQELCDLVVGT